MWICSIPLCPGTVEPWIAAQGRSCRLPPLRHFEQGLQHSDKPNGTIVAYSMRGHHYSFPTQTQHRTPRARTCGPLGTEMRLISGSEYFPAKESDSGHFGPVIVHIMAPSANGCDITSLGYTRISGLVAGEVQNRLQRASSRASSVTSGHDSPPSTPASSTSAASAPAASGFPHAYIQVHSSLLSAYPLV